MLSEGWYGHNGYIYVSSKGLYIFLVVFWAMGWWFVVMGDDAIRCMGGSVRGGDTCDDGDVLWLMEFLEVREKCVDFDKVEALWYFH